MEYQRRLRDLREDHDKTQQEIADVLGTSQTMYARYERGANELPVRHLIKLAEYYHVSTDYLLGLSNQRQPPAGQRETGQTGCLTRMEKSRPKMKACCDRKHGESGQQGANGPEHRT